MLPSQGAGGLGFATGFQLYGSQQASGRQREEATGATMLYVNNWFSLLLYETISGLRAKTSSKTIGIRDPPIQSSKNGHQKLAATPPTLRVGCSCFWMAGSHFLILY